MVSLIQLLRQRYLDTINSVRPANGRWKILVVDQHTQDLLNNVLKMFEILELGVQQVEVIDDERSPVPNLEAVYILAPTDRNVDKVIRDFAPTSRRGDPNPNPSGGTMYAGAHLFFVDGLDDRLVEKLTNSPASSYLLQLVELFTNVWANEAQVFTLQPSNRKSLFNFYAPPSQSSRDPLKDWHHEINWTSKSIINSLAILGENPLIRYYNPSTPALGAGAEQDLQLCKTLALKLQDDLDEYCRNNPDFPPPSDPPRPRATFFITERAMDLQAPLLHEFTYQSMCNDLLDIADGTRYTYATGAKAGEVQEKEAILSDDDKVWTEVRHMHMKEALDKLIKDFQEYAGKQGAIAKGTSINDMKDILADLPHLQESKEKLSLHLSMAETCMDLLDKRKLLITASVEQSCATGITAEGKTPKTLVEEMVPLLDDGSLTSTDKLRIIALYILFRDGVNEEDKRRLYQHARLSTKEMDAVNNLIYLGANVTKDSGKKRKVLFKQPVDEEAYDDSRYHPLVKLMLEEHITNKLDMSLFPYVKDAPQLSRPNASAQSSAGGSASLRSARPRWQMARSKGAVETHQRLLVFVAGGMTWGEVRSAYAVSTAHSKDVIIGSTHIYTPKDFVRDLSDMERRGGPSKSHGGPVRDGYGEPARGPAPTPDPRRRDRGGGERGPPPPSSRGGRYDGGEAPAPEASLSSQSGMHNNNNRSARQPEAAAANSYRRGSEFGGEAARRPMQSAMSSTTSFQSSIAPTNGDVNGGGGREEGKKKGLFSRKPKK